MSTTLILLVGGLAIVGLVALGRSLEATSWRNHLVAFRLHLPAKLTTDDVTRWLSLVAASTHPAQWSLLPLPPVGIEVVGTADGIAHYLLVRSNEQAKVLSAVRAALPGTRITEAPEYLAERAVFRVAAEAALTSVARPLADRAEVASTAMLATLQPVPRGSTVVLSWLVTSAGTPRPIPQPKTADDGPELPWWLEAEAPADSDEVRARRIKQREPLLKAVCRVGVVALTRGEALRLFSRTWSSLHVSNAPGVRLVRRWAPPVVVTKRLQRRSLPVLRYPILANAKELSGLMALAAGGVTLPGLAPSVARQLPPPVAMSRRGTVVGVSNYVGMTERPLTLKTSDRLRHMWIMGPTGTGKSTLLANLALQDIAAGRGVVLIDPAKGDVVADVLNRMPPHRRDDVVVVAPSRTAYPIGLNVLNTGYGEQAAELAVDALVHLMSSLWRSSFGPRTADVLRNALLTLTHTRAADGSANTLLELPEILLNPSFRAFILAQPGVPSFVRPFWAAYDSMRDGERAQVIGPSLNKLRSFTTRTPLRLMLGQSNGIRLDEVFTRRRVFLFDLSKGLLGSDTTALIGSLVMAGLTQATLERAAVPPASRHPVSIYADEFQDFLKFATDVPDLLAQARGLGVGMVLAHQYLDQLTDELRNAVLGTVRTQVVFQVEHDDATVLARRFAPLTSDDLTGLASYEIAMRPCVDGSTVTPVTGRTLPLPTATTDGIAVALASQQRFGTPRIEVEAAIHARITPPTHSSRFGRSTLEGDV